MHLTLRQFEIFVAVADTGSTTAAGARIALSQSATSASLGELETVLDSKLFDRIGRRLVLNDVGRALLQPARAALHAVRDIEQQFGLGPHAPGQATRHSGKSGAAAGPSAPAHLRLGASTTIGNYVLPERVAAHLRAWPNDRIDVRVGNTREIAAAAARMEVDLGLIEGPCHEPDLLVEPWREDELVLVCAPGHPLALQTAGGAAPLDVSALAGAAWLLREPGSGTREMVEHMLLPHLGQVAAPLQPGSNEAIMQAAAAGVGVACLSRFAVRDLVALGRLTVLSTELPRLLRRFYFVRHRAKHPSAGLERFLSGCVPQATGEAPPEALALEPAGGRAAPAR